MSPDIYDTIHSLTHSGASFAVATVVRVEKPISARPGDKGIITTDGALQGWVGGGCSQDIVVREALKAIRTGEPRFLRLLGAGTVPTPAAMLDGIYEYPITCHSGGSMDVYLDPVLPRPQVILLGTSPVAVTLAKLAKVMNFEVAVCDPQATHHDFPGVDLLQATNDLMGLAIRPNAFAVVATQGHDDEGALEAAVRSSVSYSAFVASRKKLAASAEFLRERGLSEAKIGRIKAPAGLDIGAVTPDEIAVSILAELVQVRRRPPAITAEVVTTSMQSEGMTETVAGEAIDPVCGMTVEITAARYTSDYQNAKYYFCAAGCKRQFDADPAKFVKA